MTKIFVSTLPKSGTHYVNVLLPEMGFERHRCELGEHTAALISKDPETSAKAAMEIALIAEAMPADSFILDHVPYSKHLMHQLMKRGIHAVVLVRNAYDFVVSLAHHLRRDPPPNLPVNSKHAIQHWICTDGGFDEDGTPAPPLAKRYLTRFGGWVSDERVFTLRFEDIIGPRGGGLFSDQLATGLALRDFLGIELDNGDLARALIHSFRPDAPMFRKGQIGSWRTEMAENTAEQIRLLFPRALEQFGYTIDGELLHHPNQRPDMLEQMDLAVPGLVQDNVHMRMKISRYEVELGLEEIKPERQRPRRASDESGDDAQAAKNTSTK